ACWASLADAPRPDCSRDAISKWLRTSSCRSCSRLAREPHRHFIRLLRMAWLAIRGACLSQVRLQHSRNSVLQLLPPGEFVCQLLFSPGSQPVILRALIVVRSLPLRSDPLLLFQAVERGIKRSGVHLEDFAGARANRDADAVTVPRAPLQGLQNQEIQGSLQQLDAILVLHSHGTILPGVWSCSRL